MSKVKGGVNMLGAFGNKGNKKRRLCSSKTLLGVECRFLPKSKFQWTTSQRFLSPRFLFWSQCVREPLLWAHFSRGRRVARWQRAEGDQRLENECEGCAQQPWPAVFSYLAIFQSRCKLWGFYFHLYWCLTKAECIIQLFEPTSLQEKLTCIGSRIFGQ